MSVPAFLAQGGGGGGGQWLQLLGIIVVVGFSALSWIIQKLSEQHEKKKQRDLMERRKLEALRTGRDEHSPAAPPVASAPVQRSATDRQRELAAKRQAQLEELRRRQQERIRAQQDRAATIARAPTQPPRPATPTPRQPPIVFIPGSSGPIVVPPRQGQQQRPPARPGTPQRRPTQTAARIDNRRTATTTRQRAATQRTPTAPEEQAPKSSASVSHGLLSDINIPTASLAQQGKEPAAPAGGSSAAARLPGSSSDWRRALVMREVLGPPLSLRPPGEDVLG